MADFQTLAQAMATSTRNRLLAPLNPLPTTPADTTDMTLNGIAPLVRTRIEDALEQNPRLFIPHPNYADHNDPHDVRTRIITAIGAAAAEQRFR